MLTHNQWFVPTFTCTNYFFFINFFLDKTNGWKMCMPTSCILMKCWINSRHSNVLTFFWHKVYSLQSHVICGFVQNQFCISFEVMQKWNYLQQIVWNLVHGRVSCIIASKMFSWFYMRRMQIIRIVGPLTIKMENDLVFLHYWLQCSDFYWICIMFEDTQVH